MSRQTIGVAALQYTYQGARGPALKELAFNVHRGEIFGFLGPNGAGKSTTQKILIGLLQGYRGEVEVLGKSLSAWTSAYYERIGVAFEVPNHYSKLTGHENLAYFGALYEGATPSPTDLLQRVDLADDAAKTVAHYSKGMKRRLGVARALLNDPELLFLDEPTGGLDPVSGRRIKDLIREQRDLGKTVFLTTHDMAVADDLCDRIGFIVDGAITTIDSPRELKLRYGQHRVRVEYAEGGTTSSADFPLANLADNPDFLRVLRQYEVQTIHSLEATLEDVFIQITGRSLS